MSRLPPVNKSKNFAADERVANTRECAMQGLKSGTAVSTAPECKQTTEAARTATRGSAPASSVFRAMVATTLVAIVAAIFLAIGGCQLIDTRDDGPSESGAERDAALDSQVGDTVRLLDAIDRMQAGDGEQALAVLRRLQSADPASNTLRLLRRQVETDPEEILPGPYRNVTVQRGESLSQIAARDLGNPLLFYALARLNGIDEPRRIQTGTVLRVPESMSVDGGAERRPELTDAAPEQPEATEDDATMHDSEPAGPDDTDTTIIADTRMADAAAADDRAGAAERSELETVARYLLSNGQPTDARQMLLEAARSGRISPRAEQLLVELTLDHSEAERLAGRYDSAVAALTGAAGVLSQGALRQRLAHKRQRVEIESLLERASAFQRESRYDQAHALAREAVVMDPQHERAVAVEAMLREALVNDFHERALRAWRARDIDLAIRTWQRLLEVEPDFEPAQVYLERAKRLRQRLSEPTTAEQG